MYAMYSSYVKSSTVTRFQMRLKAKIPTNVSKYYMDPLNLYYIRL